MTDDTIAAIATPPGTGGVGIIRISGAAAVQIGQTISCQKIIKPRKAYFTKLVNSKHEVIDEAILLYFKSPNSYTGEDVVELQGHGGPFILQQVLQTVITLGARQALPGEFSERAFLNNKMDLIQVEAVADLIHARSNAAATAAIKSLQGNFSKVIDTLSDKILHLRTFIEASLDFSDEEIDFLSDGKVLEQFLAIQSQVKKTIDQASYGKLLQEGLSVVLVGEPNAGKSSLLNQLLDQDRAIVTEIAGTTRDTLEETILIQNIPVKITDTAGLRQTSNQIEKIGIDRAKLAIKQADYIIWLRDINQLDDTLPDELTGRPYLEVHNKCDQVQKQTNALQISAKTGEGLELLQQKIANHALVNHHEENIFSARERHINALHLADEHIQHGLDLLNSNYPSDLVAEELRLAHLALCQITGTFTSDDLLGEIFSTFCVGK